MHSERVIFPGDRTAIREAAVAHALALLEPGRPVIDVTGDGAFGFTVAELDTAVRYGLAAVHVIHDNQAWGVIA